MCAASDDDSSGSEHDGTPDHSYYIGTPSLRYDPPGGLVDDWTTGNPFHSTDTCDKCKNDIRKTWKLINDILSKPKKQPSQKSFKEGENIINDKVEIAHKFNNFFYKYWAKSCKYDKY